MKVDTAGQVFLAVAGFAIGFILGAVIFIKALANDAVKNGKAEYYLDENNERQWRWKK